MKWRKHNEYTAISDTDPAYKVCKYPMPGETAYRTAFNGSFFGGAKYSWEEAKAACEEHEKEAER